MLHLQMASAGSGKTYTLTRQFIWFLIAIKDEKKGWRIRNEFEIKDALGRILAITFTNKATNEMKCRIIDKLALLAMADTDITLDEKFIHDTDYLIEFAENLNADYRTIGKACRIALSHTLNNYSDFHVSTIDSFFQNILRTFTYETNLNDNYQVELNTEYISSAAIDTTLHELDREKKSKSAASFWLDQLMEAASVDNPQWNIFTKKEGSKSIYSALKDSFSKTENEQFKALKDRLEDYFNNQDGANKLIKFYATIKKKIEKKHFLPLSIAKKDASEISEIIKQADFDRDTDFKRFFISHLEKIKKLTIYESPSSKNFFSPLKLDPKCPDVFKERNTTPEALRIDALAAEMYDEYKKWISLRQSEEWLYWEIYSPLIPYFGLLMEVREYVRTILDDNNLIQLGDTNAILRKIIGDDDTPFVYEKLGTFLNHFLIDEFQDTSSLQWEVLRPLLLESNARGMDNLIIGDAKQSIYRFRNADPSLISEKVPQDFEYFKLLGKTLEENTNWRSDRVIVEFNNFFFSALSLLMEEKKKGNKKFFNELYSNVVQYPSHQENAGYVEVNFLQPDDYPSEDGSYENEDDANDNLKSAPLFNKVTELICSLIKRGYRQKDIAVIVNKNKYGKQIINSFIEFNLSRKPDEIKIEFVSDESLLISTSEAVSVIINVLKLISGKPGKLDAKNAGFSLFVSTHPNMSPDELAKAYKDSDYAKLSISSIMDGMQSTALPALIESIIEKFMPLSLKVSDAAFIAAFEDCVLDYCERFPTDPVSFLEWWNEKGINLSISSPEDTDAVKVLTIHKSKGLEFKCVILPFSFYPMTLRSNKSEWSWVKPKNVFEDNNLPPYLPVKLSKRLEKTVHADKYFEYYDDVIMDNLNNTYVAFTRAVNELYVFTKLPSKNANSNLGSYISSICEDAGEYLSHVPDSLKSLMIQPDDINWNEDKTVLSIGHTINRIYESDKIKDNSNNIKEGNGMMPIIRTIEKFDADGSRAILRYKEEDIPESMESDEEDNPRSIGNLLHAVMARINTKDDIATAFLYYKTRGLLSQKDSEEWESYIRKAIENHKVAGWFDRQWKIYTERTIFMPGRTNRRPDRIMINADGNSAIIIDYKFGDNENTKKYTRQIENYIKSLRKITGIQNITGYIWYIKLDKLIAIC